MKYVKLCEVFRLQVCYTTANKYATVITRVKDEVSLDQEDTAGLNSIDMLWSWNPTDLLSRYKENKQDELIQREYFHHIMNHVSRQNWQIGNANVKPGDCLDVEMSEVQQVLLNPTTKDMLIGFMT